MKGPTLNVSSINKNKVAKIKNKNHCWEVNRMFEIFSNAENCSCFNFTCDIINIKKKINTKENKKKSTETPSSPKKNFTSCQGQPVTMNINDIYSIPFRIGIVKK